MNVKLVKRGTLRWTGHVIRMSEDGFVESVRERLNGKVSGVDYR